MEISHYHVEDVSCIGHDCHHEVSMEICEKIQSDEMQVSTDALFLEEDLTYISFDVDVKRVFFNNENSDYLENIPISYKQLARSHL